MIESETLSSYLSSQMLERGTARGTAELLVLFAEQIVFVTLVRI